jgi:hypothetical protein
MELLESTEIIDQYDPLTGQITKAPWTTTRMYIPSRVQDNKILMTNDPGYIARLHEIGSPELVKAWLDGDWNVITGAYFPEFNLAKHVIAPFKIPDHWVRFRSMDWGSATPFCNLWHASYPMAAIYLLARWSRIGNYTAGTARRTWACAGLRPALLKRF